MQCFTNNGCTKTIIIKNQYKNHTCEPQWEENVDLDKYIVTLHENQKKRDAFVKKRNKKKKKRHHLKDYVIYQ